MAIGEAADEAACYQWPQDSLSRSVGILADQIGRRAASLHISKGIMQRLRYADNPYNVNELAMICAFHLEQFDITNENHGPQPDD